MIVKLKLKNPSYPDLSEDQPYFVIGIEADDYRILKMLGNHISIHLSFSKS